ncbi:hypothetical protein BJV78DRAFT_1152396 [Lactifluus subvellereus]|nr:hypothetical protein BJV78DRAFT_1152396 [Lactifluus subvellereus]
MYKVPNYCGGKLVGLYDFNSISQREGEIRITTSAISSLYRRTAMCSDGSSFSVLPLCSPAARVGGWVHVPRRQSHSHTYYEVLFMGTTCNTLMSYSVVIREGSALRSDLDRAKRSNFRYVQRRIGQVDELIEQLMLHQHKDEVSKVSEWDRVAVGGGRLVLGGSLKTQPGGFFEGRHHPMHVVQGHSQVEQHPHTPPAVQWRNPILVACFPAPILDPLRQPPVAERSRENKAAYGEQIQQKCHRVEQSSGCSRGERKGMAQEMEIRGGGRELGSHRGDFIPRPVSRLPTCDPASFRHRLPRNSSSDLPRWNTPSEWDSAGGDRCDSIKYQGPEAVHGGDLCVP